MLLAVDLDIPVTNFQFFLHFGNWKDEFALDGTPHVKASLTASKVAADTAPLLLTTDWTFDAKSAVIEITRELLQRLVFCLKPDLIVPIDTGMVHPLSRHQVNHGSCLVIAHEAIRQGNFTGLFSKLSAKG